MKDFIADIQRDSKVSRTRYATESEHTMELRNVKYE